MGFVFISYSHKDKEYAHKLRDDLKDRGFDPWIDDRIDYGTRWPTVIQGKVDACDAFIIIVSGNSYESTWVQNELARATRKGKKIYPILLNGDPWISIEVTQYVDVTSGELPPDKFYEQLAQQLEPISHPSDIHKPADKLAEKGIRSNFEAEAGRTPRIFQRRKAIYPFQYNLGLQISVGIVLLLGIALALRNVVQPALQATPTSVLTSTLAPTDGPTSTSTLTYTPRPTNTSTLSPTPTPKENGYYYMIVLDASARMVESFDGKSKWDAVLDAVNGVLDGREPGANYGLVVIGGSRPDQEADPCEEPGGVSLPFTNRATLMGRINQLSPNGGGSISKAFNRAKEALKALPDHTYTVRTLIFITDSTDLCEDHDEWDDVKRSLELEDANDLRLYSEVIVVEGNRLRSKKIEEILGGFSPEILGLQFPASFVQINQTNITVNNNITNYINVSAQSTPVNSGIDTPGVTMAITRTPTNTPTRSLTPIFTYTPTRTPSYTSTPTITDTPTFTATLTPSDTPPPTLGPHTWNILVSHPEVFSLGCPLIDPARLYAQFFNNLARINTTLPDNQYAGKGISLQFFNIRGLGANYAGWEVWLGPDDTHGTNLSSYSSLAFYIRGNSGGERLNVYLMNPTVNEVYRRYWKHVEEVSPVTTSWQRIVIPLSHFTSSTEEEQVVDLTNVQRIQIVFEWYENFESGQVFVDDMCVE